MSNAGCWDRTWDLSVCRYSRYLHEQDSIRQKLNELEVKKRLAEDLRRQVGVDIFFMALIDLPL